MAPANLVIHIPPDANPSNIQQMLSALSRETTLHFATVADLLQFLEEANVGYRTEIQSTAAATGLLDKGPSGICLSERGLALAQVRDDARADLLHFLLYTGWSPETPMTFLPSWSYRQCCLRYWREGQVELTGDYLEKQVAEMIAEAPTVFSPYGQFENVSFSRKSLTGAHNWLNALKPPVIEQRIRFTRRTFCPPELMVLVIDHILRNEPDVTEYDILLTREKREAIAQICLLEPERFDPTLDWAISTFPHLIGPGTRAGSYGRFIRLFKRLEISDVIR